MKTTKKEIRVITPNGSFLSLSLEKPEGQIKGTALIMHGRSSNKDKSGYLDQARICIESGFQSARFDFRGHGKSSWSPSWEDCGILDQKADIESVLGYLRKENLIKGKLVFIASSFSAEAALLFASDHSEVESLILISPGLGKRPAGTEDNRYRSEWWDKNPKVTQIPFGSYKKALSGVHQKIFSLHGDKDTNVPMEQSKELEGLIGTNFHIYIIKNGAHSYIDPEVGMHQRQELLEEILSAI